MKTVGIDAGSLAAKVVVLGEGGIEASTVVPASDFGNGNGAEVLHRVLPGHGPDGVRVVSTGAGGRAVELGAEYRAITTCLARGVHHLAPGVRTVIDMGAETITVVRINERGRVSDYGNQDKCAAGTGLFLQQMAKLLRLSLEEMSAASAGSRNRVEITGTCAVFAESEIISHIHRNPPTPVADLVAGIYRSMAHRIVAQMQRVGVCPEVAATGGLAANAGLISLLEEEVGQKITVPPMSQLAGAIGAALIARENAMKAAGL